MMKNPHRLRSVLFTFFLGCCCILSGYGQNNRFDSLLMGRQKLVNVYDSLRSQSITDTGAVNTNSILKAANDVFSYDNSLINNEISKILLASDSLLRINSLHESSFQGQILKIRDLNNLMLFIAVAGAICLILFFFILFAWYKRRKTLNKFAIQHLETERILAEYRKKLNELQSDLDNCRTQAKSLVHENSQHEKEIGQLSEELQKARDAGWLAESGEISYPEQIRNLEEKLEAEATRKKILEQEMLEILRKIRGEE